MDFFKNQDLKVIVRPYLFVLREGKAIQKDFLDYSLQMLQVTCPEIIPSPGQVRSSNPLAPSLAHSCPQETARNNMTDHLSSQ